MAMEIFNCTRASSVGNLPREISHFLKFLSNTVVEGIVKDLTTDHWSMIHQLQFFIAIVWQYF